MAKLSESELKALLGAERSDALASFHADKLTKERTRALDYYMGDISDDVPSIDGRSTAVSMDVADTVEGLMPSLIEIFAGSDDAVRFEPVGPEDQDAADQETEYVKHIFWNKNDGFNVLYSMIKDALLTKLGVVKVWFEEDEREKTETYEDQSDEQLSMILMDPNVEIIEHTPKQTGQLNPMTGAPVFYHDVTIMKKEDYSCAKVMAIPPEEFGIARRARCIRDSHYCFHEPNGGRAVADLVAEGYDPAQIDRLPTYAHPEYTEKWARDTVDETNHPEGDSGINKAMRPIRVTEHYIRMDYEGKGKAKLYRVVTGGEDSTILRRNGKLDIEEWDMMPFAGITPFIMPHRVFGRSIADVVMDLQRQKSVILRGMLDNVYAANMPRPVVVEQLSTTETLDDLAVMSHAAAIRTKGQGAIEWMQVPPIVNHVFPVMQYLDSLREWRTGVSRQGQGLDADALNNQTATAAMQLYNASQARMKLIARIFAETGIKDMFWLLHATIRKNANKSETIRLLNKWVPVDPRNWIERNDITVTVGLGQGGKAERLTEMQALIALQTSALQGGMPWVKPKHLYNAGREVCKIMEKEVDLYFDDPGDAEMPKGQNPEEIKAQTEVMKAQMQAQFKEKELQMKAEIEKLQAEADIATNDRKIEADIVLAERKFEFERELKAAEFQMEQQLKMLDIQSYADKHDMEMEKFEFDLINKLPEGAEADMTGMPISKQIKELGEIQKQVLETQAKLMEIISEEREITITKDDKGKVIGATSRRKANGKD